jgi:hypothetical protein
MLNNDKSTVSWPAVIVYNGDVELLPVATEANWTHDQSLQYYQDSDYLLDSLGNTFDLSSRVNGRAIPQTLDNKLNLAEVLRLVRAHAAQTGSCCVAKIYAPSILDALKLVQSLSDN